MPPLEDIGALPFTKNHMKSYDEMLRLYQKRFYSRNNSKVNDNTLSAYE